MKRKQHDTTKILRQVLTDNKVDCKRIYNYDSKHQTNSKAYLITTKKKLSGIKNSLKQGYPDYDVLVIKSKKGTSVRVVKMK